MRGPLTFPAGRALSPVERLLGLIKRIAKGRALIFPFCQRSKANLWLVLIRFDNTPISPCWTPDKWSLAPYGVLRAHSPTG